MLSNLPDELAIYTSNGKRATFAFYTGHILKHDHQVFEHVTVHPGGVVKDVYGRILHSYPGYVSTSHTYQGTIQLKTVTNDIQSISYAEPRLDCAEGQRFTAVFCNNRFVGFENYQTRMRYWFGELYRQTGSSVVAHDFFGVHFVTVIVALLAMWYSQLFRVGVGLMFLNWSPTTYAGMVLPAFLYFLFLYFVTLLVLNPILAMSRRPRAKKRILAIFDFVSTAWDNKRIPVRRREIERPRKRHAAAGTIALLLCALASLVPLGLLLLRYMPAKGIPHPPVIASVAAWFGVLTAGILAICALARHRWTRPLAWILALALCWFVYNLKPAVVVKAIYPPLLWLGLGTHFLWVLAPIAMVWMVVKLLRPPAVS